MKDGVVLAALLLSFATLVTMHVAIVVRLIWSATPRYRGIVALVVPPLAPVWAYEQQWRRMCWIWVGALLVYAAFLATATL